MRWTIRTKLYAMVVVLASAPGGLGAITYERFGRTAQIEDELNHAHHIENLSSFMNESLLEARRREKDFLLREGDAKYRDMVAIKARREVPQGRGRAARSLPSGSSTTTSARPSDLASELEDGMKDYLGDLRQGGHRLSREGAARDGRAGPHAQGGAHDLERVVPGHSRRTRLAGAPAPAAPREKDYLLRGDLKYQEHVAQGHAAKLAAELGAAGEDAEARRRSQGEPGQLRRQLRSVVAADRRMIALLTQLHEIHSAIEPKLDELGQAGAAPLGQSLAARCCWCGSKRCRRCSSPSSACSCSAPPAVTWVSRQNRQRRAAADRGHASGSRSATSRRRYDPLATTSSVSWATASTR